MIFCRTFNYLFLINTHVAFCGLSSLVSCWSKKCATNFKSYFEKNLYTHTNFEIYNIYNNIESDTNSKMQFYPRELLVLNLSLLPLCVNMSVHTHSSKPSVESLTVGNRSLKVQKRSRLNSQSEHYTL